MLLAVSPQSQLQNDLSPWFLVHPLLGLLCHHLTDSLIAELKEHFLVLFIIRGFGWSSNRGSDASEGQNWGPPLIYMEA